MGAVQADLVEKALPGAIDHADNWVSFALYAPKKKSVHIIGSFNDWDRRRDPLEQREPGYWVTTFQLDKGSYQNQFVIDFVMNSLKLMMFASIYRGIET
jgi:1,4-alpha-glucan branching enzyme